MSVIGIDPDTKQITSAWRDVGGWQFRAAQAKERIAEHRFLPLIMQFRMMVNDLAGATWVYVERPPMGVNPRSTIDQAMVVGAILCILHERGIGRVSLVDPGTWKKGLIGNGRADKPLIKQWAIANLGVEDGLGQDFYDAAAISAWGSLPLRTSYGEERTKTAAA